MKRKLSFICLLFLSACATAADYRWTNVGLGGGGGQFTPGSSPVDTNFMIVSCDMGGVYRSTSGGRTWELVDWHEMHSMAYAGIPVFNTLNPSVVFAWGTKGNGAANLMKSCDKGATWNVLTSSAPWEENTIISLYIDRNDTNILLAGTDFKAFFSTNGGTSWTACAGVTGKALGFFTVGTASSGRTWFAATEAGIFASSDGGITWTANNGGLPAGKLKSFSGGSLDASTSILYCIMAENSDVYRSKDMAKTWERSMGPGIDTASPLLSLCCAANAGAIVYVNIVNDYAVFKSADRGDSWKQVYTPSLSGGNVEAGWLTYEWGPGWGGPLNLGFSVNAGRPDIVMGTNYGETILTRNGGVSWQQVYSSYAGSGGPAKGKQWTSKGLEVTTVWHYYIDPFDSNKHYICYTDIGCGRSEDGGATWYCGVKGSPWQNTFYEMAFDSSQPGTIFAAAANQHDIPYWTQSEGPKLAGGVVKSTDFGITWASVSTGLPDASLKIPARSIVLDQSDKSLYVAMFGDGIYRSTDGGVGWVKKSTGLFVGANKHVCSIQQHRDKSLFCLISAKRVGNSGFPDAGGLFKSSDKGETWTNITLKVEGNNPLYYPSAFCVHPTDPSIIYLTTVNTQGHAQGGLYKTADGGASWTRIVFPVSDQWGTTAGLGVSLDPKDPAHIFFSTESFGVLESGDTGKSWREVEGLRFQTVIRTEIDYSGKRNDPLLHVCTYGGGVWNRTPAGAAVRGIRQGSRPIGNKPPRAFFHSGGHRFNSGALTRNPGRLIDAQGRIVQRHHGFNGKKTGNKKIQSAKIIYGD
jgi:photosystem II stability/assembly factor-like uncharacterized protein